MMVRDGPPKSEVSMVIKNDKVRWIIGTAANLISCAICKVDRTVKYLFGFDVYRSDTMRPVMNWLDNNLEDLMIEYDHRNDPIF
jgi:hypothetical protein